MEQVAPDWEAITDSMPERECFHQIEWYRCYLDSLANNSENALFLAVYENGEPLAIFPFFRSTRGFGLMRQHVLELPNHPHLPFGDFIIAPGADVAVCTSIALDELRRQPELKWDAIFLPRVLESSSAVAAWRAAAFPSMTVVSRDAEPCDYVTVKPYDEFFKGLSSGARSNLRRSRKRADQLEKFRFSSATTFPELERAFDEFLELEASGWKGHQGRGTAIRLDPQLVSFYKLLLERLAPSGGCAIYRLHDGDRPICAAFGLISSGTFYGLKMGYDEEFKMLSPGSLLQECILQAYADSGDVHCMNLISHTAWQRCWKPGQFASYELKLFRRSARGRSLLVQQKLLDTVRSLKHTFREKFLVSERGKLRLRAFSKSGKKKPKK